MTVSIFVAVLQSVFISSYIDHQDHTVHLKENTEKMKLREDSVMTYSHQSPPIQCNYEITKINETFIWLIK